MTTATGPLAGYRVLDLTAVVLGPYATQTLGDWGADVIKVEPLAGDLVRNAGAARHRGMASIFLGCNRNKRSVALDLKQPEAVAVIHALLPRVDVLVSNVRPAGMTRLGLGWDACRALNPRLVYAVATGFGQDGPHRARPAFDEVIQAGSGLAAVAGTADKPAFVPSLIADKVTGLALLSATLAALLHRERTGQGQLVEVPMLETLTAFMAIEYLGGHAFEPAIGPPGYERLRHRAPLATADGWITLLPYSGRNWRDFLGACGREDVLARFDVDDPVARNRHIDAIYAAVAEIARTRTTTEWLALCERVDVPAAAITAIEDLPEHPHLSAVGMFESVEHPTEGAIRQVRPATRFGATPAAIRTQPPLLGEHTAEVLEELGYAEADIAALCARGIAARPG